jgi:hypothetical protein
MSSSIAETVNGALTQAGLAQYQSHARPVVDALNAREADLAEQLIGYATREGMSEEAATAALRQAGMFIREPAPTGTIASADAANRDGDSGGDLAAVLDRINETLTSLAQFARSNGWRG